MLRRFIKNKIMLKIMLLSIAIFPCNYSEAGTLQYWYSDKDAIGKFPDNAFIYGNNFSGKTASQFPFESSVSNAISEWSNAGIPCYTGNAASNILFYGGTRAQLNQLEYFNYDSGTLGETKYTSKSVSYTALYQGNAKTVYNFAKINTSICYNSSGNSKNYKKTALHELGHSLGWMGHSSGEYVMTQGLKEITSLTQHDKQHLLQVY